MNQTQQRQQSTLLDHINYSGGNMNNAQIIEQSLKETENGVNMPAPPIQSMQQQQQPQLPPNNNMIPPQPMQQQQSMPQQLPTKPPPVPQQLPTKPPQPQQQLPGTTTTAGGLYTQKKSIFQTLTNPKLLKKLIVFSVVCMLFHATFVRDALLKFEIAPNIIMVLLASANAFICAFFDVFLFD